MRRFGGLPEVFRPSAVAWVRRIHVGTRATRQPRSTPGSVRGSRRRRGTWSGRDGAHGAARYTLPCRPTIVRPVFYGHRDAGFMRSSGRLGFRGRATQGEYPQTVGSDGILGISSADLRIRDGWLVEGWIRRETDAHNPQYPERNQWQFPIHPYRYQRESEDRNSYPPHTHLIRQILSRDLEMLIEKHGWHQSIDLGHGSWEKWPFRAAGRLSTLSRQLVGRDSRHYGTVPGQGDGGRRLSPPSLNQAVPKVRGSPYTHRPF